MRMHISLEDELVAQLDQRVGARRRSAFISATLRKALEDERRWEDIEAGIGALAGSEHEWDTDPAAWVRAGRTGDPARLG
jgi:metal-responsive CopG/Arc/MetJ family transcriptional regulator